SAAREAIAGSVFLVPRVEQLERKLAGRASPLSTALLTRDRRAVALGALDTQADVRRATRITSNASRFSISVR
ncbi:MAG TPA: hypothetical protein VL242_02925, partial [Sorangium sp.]|nr:hypothetical protein [Sorangium sp.]